MKSKLNIAMLHLNLAFACLTCVACGGQGNDGVDVYDAAEMNDVADVYEDIGGMDVSADIRCPDGYAGVPAGTFMMGSPADEPGRLPNEIQRKVTVSGDFCVKKTEVTRGEWVDLMAIKPDLAQTCGDDNPIFWVSWWDAVGYCNELSAKAGLTKCYALDGCRGIPGDMKYVCSSVTFLGTGCDGYRLPTEAEWELAARAGTRTATYNGTSTLVSCEEPNDVLDPIASYCGNLNLSWGTICPYDAGTLAPNALGLGDMLGGAWEWTGDWYEVPSGDAVTDPTGAAIGPGRVCKGGSWKSGVDEVRSAARKELGASRLDEDVGFRPVIRAR